MRDVVLAFGLVAIWMVGSPIYQERLSRPETSAAAPAWLAIPLDADITEVNLSPIRPTGNLSAVSDLSAEAVIKIMKTRLALQGFEILDRTTDLDRATGAASVFEAANPTDGRLAVAVVVDTPTGALLRIDFSAQDRAAVASNL